MEPVFEWYQLLVLYLMGTFMIFGSIKFSQSVNELYKINHYFLSFMYLASGYIGLKLMVVQVDSPGNKESSIWVESWNLLITSPLHLGANLIVLFVVFSLIAIVPLMAMLLLYSAYKWMTDPEFFKEL